MKVTAVIPCYNSMRFLKECVDSVLNQDYPDLHVWAYDNESSDGTYEYLLELEKDNDNLRVFQLPNIYPNGYGEAQEHIIENLETDYVTFVGSDDFIDPNYISNCMKIISHNPEKIKCLQSGIIGIQNGNVVNHQTHSYKSIEEFKNQCLNKSPVNTPTLVFHKSVIKHLRTHKAHTHNNVSCIGGGDYDTYCFMADIGIFIFPVPKNLGYKYRWHENQCTWKVHEQKHKIDYDKLIQNYWKQKWNL